MPCVAFFFFLYKVKEITTKKSTRNDGLLFIVGPLANRQGVYIFFSAHVLQDAHTFDIRMYE